MESYDRGVHPSSQVTAFPTDYPFGQMRRVSRRFHLGAPIRAARVRVDAVAEDHQGGPKKSIEVTASSTAHPRRHSIWPMIPITLGLLASLAWSVFLIWAIGRMIEIW